jgi:endonuclease/exonuclease/phosphatase family metal-dependent hydrolase
MKKVFKITGIIFCVAVSAIYLLSSLSAFIPSSSFLYIGIFGMAFPYILLLTILLCVIYFFIEKKTAIIILCILPFGFRNFTSTFALNKTDWQNKKDSGTLRIMTWNVEGFINLLHKQEPASGASLKILDVIKEMHPDVLCLQEYFDVEQSNWAVSMLDKLDSAGYHFHYFSNDHLMRFDKHSLLVRGVALFSKTPFTDSGRLNIYHYETENENAIFADINYNNKPLRIFTAHLLSFSLFEDTANDTGESKNIYRMTFKRKRSVFHKLTGTELAHEKEVTTIRNEINKSPYPVIYCGDMNTTATSYNYRFLKGNLRDAFIDKGFGIGATFYKIIPTLRIDYCFVDDKMKVMQCKTEEKKISDHYPVIADLQWK